MTIFYICSYVCDCSGTSFSGPNCNRGKKITLLLTRALVTD